MRKLATMALVLMAAGGLAACSETVDRDGTVDQMVEEGVPRDQAECVVDNLVDAFGDERALELNDNTEELTAEEEEKLTEITAECIPVDFSDVSIPDDLSDISIPEE